MALVSLLKGIFTAGIPTGLSELQVGDQIPKAQLEPLSVSDVAGAAPLASPALTGTPSAPTAATADNSTTLATTAHVQAKIAANAPGLAPVQSVAGRTGAVVLGPTDVGAPSTTGTGATGTWGISITGNAATVTSITSAQVTTALGYTPVNKAGDSGLGNMSMAELAATDGSFINCVFVNNSGSGSGGGIGFGASLVNNSPAYGIAGRLTANIGFGNYGAVSGDYAIYSMISSGGNNRGWIWQYASVNIASLSGSGDLTIAGKGIFGSTVAIGPYTVATLPAGTASMMTYAENGRKAGEGAGAGTGVLVIYTNGAWRDPSQAYAVVVA